MRIIHTIKVVKMIHINTSVKNPFLLNIPPRKRFNDPDPFKNDSEKIATVVIVNKYILILIIVPMYLWETKLFKTI